MSIKLTLKGPLRPRGLYIAGNPGAGKSSLLQNLALQDIANSHGVAVIDPTGDLVPRLVHHIPKWRAKQTIYFDTDNPIPIDFFSYSNRAERLVLTDVLLDIFDLEDAPLSRPNLEQILGTLFDANENPNIPDEHRCTFLDILYFITDKARREQILSYAPRRKADWEGDPFKPFDYRSITKRMTPFKENPVLKTMFGAKKPKLSIADVMRDNLVLLVNIKDTPSDFFVASLITSKFQQATFGRRYVAEHLRAPYYLYIDECHTVLKYSVPQFEAILTRARKYKLCLTLSNQLPSHLPAEIQRMLGIFYTKILFNLKEQDARPFKSEIEHSVSQTPPPPPDYEKWNAENDRVARELERTQHEINFLNDRRAKGDMYDHVSPQKLNRLLYDHRQLLNKVNQLPAYYFPLMAEPLSYLELLKLPDFTALAITGSTVTKIRTPQFLGFSSASYARYIKKRTLDIYAGQTREPSGTDKSSPTNIYEEPKPIPHIAVPPSTTK